jgi:hypothetical protein
MRTELTAALFAADEFCTGRLCLNHYRLKPVGCIATESRSCGLSRLKGLPAQAGLRLGGLRYLEALRIVIPPLVLDVLHDRLLIHYAHRRAKLAPRPHVLTPVSLAQMRKILLQLTA